MNNSSNADCCHYACADDLDEIFTITKILFAISMTVVNFTVLIVYMSFKNGRKKISNFLLLNQALTDLYVAICQWYELSIEMDSRHIRLLMLVNIGMFEYSLVLSLGSLFLGAIERYLSITKALYHRRKVTFACICQSATCLWFVTLLPTIILLSLMDFNPDNLDLTHVKIYSYAVDGVMLILIITVVYMLLVTLKAARISCNVHVKLSHLPRSSQRRARTETRARKKSTRLLVIFIIMISAYVITFIPFVAARICYDSGVLNDMSPCKQIIIGALSHLLYKSSALFNPFLTMLLKQDYRKALLGFVKRKRTFDTIQYTRATRQHDEDREVKIILASQGDTTDST